jgi:hypothetical protein
METTQRISLSQTSKNAISFLLTFVFFFNKIRQQEVRTGSAQKGGAGLPQIMYTNVSICKNDKIKIF